MHLIVVMFFCFAFQQEQPNFVSAKAESVIADYVRAKGGLENLMACKGISLKGIAVSNGAKIGEFESYQVPRRHLSIHRFQDGLVRKHGTDGKIVWNIDGDGRATILKGQQARDYLRHYESLHESLEWHRQFRAIHYVGEKKIRNKRVHHLLFLADDNRQINRYFSLETGFLIQEEQILENKGDTQIQISEIRKYEKDASGIWASRSRLNHFGSDYSIEYVVTSMEINQLDENDQRFALPGSVARLITKDD